MEKLLFDTDPKSIGITEEDKDGGKTYLSYKTLLEYSWFVGLDLWSHKLSLWPKVSFNIKKAHIKDGSSQTWNIQLTSQKYIPEYFWYEQACKLG